MPHPNSLAGKSVRNIVLIFDTLVDLIEREYNKDAKYRDSELEPLRRVYKGEPTVKVSTPAVAVVISDYIRTREPDGCGAEIEMNWKILCYGSENQREPQQDEAIKMAESIWQIIVDNPQISTKDGNNLVFHAAHEGMRVELDRMVSNFESDSLGIDLAVITFKAVMSENNYG